MPSWHGSQKHYGLSIAAGSREPLLLLSPMLRIRACRPPPSGSSLGVPDIPSGTIFAPSAALQAQSAGNLGSPVVWRT
jgi:hypothetical protein